MRGVLGLPYWPLLVPADLSISDLHPELATAVVRPDGVITSLLPVHGRHSRFRQKASAVLQKMRYRRGEVAHVGIRIAAQQETHKKKVPASVGLHFRLLIQSLPHIQPGRVISCMLYVDNIQLVT